MTVQQATCDILSSVPEEAVRQFAQGEKFQERLSQRKLNMPTILCLALALLAASSLPTTAAPLAVNINASVETLSGIPRGIFETDNPKHVGDPIHARIGERLRISLVGIEIGVCQHTEVPVPASFSVRKIGIIPANIDFARVDSNSFVVEFRAPGTAHLDFEANPGDDYGFYGYKLGLLQTKGSITFIVDFPSGYDEDRWLRALDLNKMLYRAILDQAADGQNPQANADLIYKQGLQGVRSVAKVLADFAEKKDLWHSKGGSSGYYSVDGLYCALLHRKTPRADFVLDPGYLINVHALDAKGISTVIENIVNSPEFRSANGF